MSAALAILRPYLVDQGVQPLGKVAIGTVKGDLHDIGKNLVHMMWEGAGFEVVDLGVNVSPEAFVAAVREHRPRILGLSALLTTTMSQMQATVEALKAAGLRDGVRVLVGGAPLTAAYAAQMGADGYAPDAASAVELARTMLAAI